MYHIKAAWLWFKENWRIPFLILWSIIVWALSRKNAQAAMDVLEVRKESYQKQIVELKENHKKELSERDKLVKQYHQAVLDIEEKYKEKNAKLTKANKERVKEIVQQSKGDSDAVKQKIEELFNLSGIG